MMISTIHCRTHQIDRTGIHPNVFLVGVLFMDGLCHKLSVRSHHKTSHFSINRNISHSGRNQNLFINLAYALTDHVDVIRCLFRLVRDSNATGKVDKFNICSGLLFKTYCQFKQLTGKLRIIFIRHRIACKESMHTKIPHTLFFQDTVSFKHLLRSKSILGISRIIHDSVTQLKNSTGIEATAHRFRKPA